METYKKYKIQSAFLEVMEKYKVYFSVFFVLFLYLLVFLQSIKYKKTDKINTKTYEHNFSKMQNTIQYEPNSSNMSQGANPMFILKSKNQLAK